MVFRKIVKCTYSKCDITDGKINRSKQEWVKEKDKNFHTDCLRKRYINKGYSEDEVDAYINELKKITEKDVQLSLDKLKEEETIKLENKISSKQLVKERDLLNDYILDTYDIKAIPTLFFSDLANVRNGTRKGLAHGISYEELLDMWKRQQKKLDGMAINKENKGQGFKTIIQRLRYDLAVLVNKYDSYSKWKKNQEKLNVKTEEQIEKIQEKKIYDSLINNRKKQIDKEEFNITDIMDELF